MRILDRYLLRQYFESYLICFCSLTGLYVVFDAFGHMDEFLGKNQPAGGLMWTLFEFYGYRSISFFERISALLTLIAGMFTLTWFQRSQEMTALWAAGITTKRILAPILIACLMTSLLAAGAREFLVPRFKYELTLTPSDICGDGVRGLQPTYDLATDILMQGTFAYVREERVSKPNFILPEKLAGRTITIAAKSAWFERANQQHPAGYRLEEIIEPPDFSEGKSLKLDDTTLVYRRGDVDWLKPNECFVVSHLSFTEWVDGERLRQYSSTPELIAGLKNPSRDFGADSRVLLHARLVQPLLDMVLLALGLPFVLAGERRNMFVAVGFCMVTTTLFLVLTLGCHWLGSISFLPPSLAAWLPLILFSPFAWWMSEPVFRGV